ncbi:hypothetical protein V2W30_39285 [Streptomyces sp. Q6]|uniref:Uncharacterized protein n=1 Tax=Streptomyces citrinus TaxID=3118173 RepID=A0ACD5APY3_9ACTN
MGSMHTFYDRRVSLTLGASALVVSRVSERRIVVPLAAVAEVRVPEPRSLEIVFTDGEIHHIDCVDSAAMAKFSATLRSVLPEQRDSAGSATITRLDDPKGYMGHHPTAFTLGALAYTGYMVWVGVTHGWRVLGPVAGVIPLFIGLILCVMAADEVFRRRDLARHGVTVEAEDIGRRVPMYYFNDADGVPHHYDGGSGVRAGRRTIRVTYDPRRPHRAVHEVQPGAVIRKVVLRLIPGVLLLALGAWLAFGLLS